MQSEYDIFAFDSVNGAVATAQLPSKYLGMPVGVETLDRWSINKWDPSKAADQEALVDNPAAPGTTNPGTDWQPTLVGAGGSLSLVDNTFPAYLQILTAATDTTGVQLQANKGATGLTKALYDTSAMSDIFFSTTFQILDANNNLASIQQTRFFFGLAAIDTSILAGIDDYIAFHKDDGTGVVNLVADQTSGVPGTGSSSLVKVCTLDASHAGKWLTLSFRAVNLDRTGQKGIVYAFFDINKVPTGASKRMSTHCATLNLGTNSDVPGANMTPSLAFVAGEAVAKRCRFTSIIAGGAYKLG